MPSVIIDPSRDFLTLETAGGRHRFHAIWLRDNAQDATTRSATNGQRLITLQDIAPDTQFAAAKIMPDAQLSVTFSNSDQSFVYDLTWLEAHAYDHAMPTGRGWLQP